MTLKAKSDADTIIEVEAQQLGLMRSLRFKPFFISLVAKTIETALGKKCDPQTMAFSPEVATKEGLMDLVARWIPVIDVILPLITADPDIQDFASRLSDDGFHVAAAKKVNALLQAMKASERLTGFAALVSDS